MSGHKRYTLLFVRRMAETGQKQILLGMKKRGFGTGKWNGFGGKVEPGETIAQGAVRELQEESGIIAHDIRERGILLFTFDELPTMEVHVFETRKYEGVPTESDEMAPQWYNEQDIPYDSMWADDRIWLPVFLRDESIVNGQMHFKDTETMMSHAVQEEKFSPDTGKGEFVSVESLPSL